MAFNRNWLSDWSKRVRLDIDTDKIDTTISGFPLLINLDGTDGITSVDIAQNIKDELGIPNDFSDTFTGADGDWDDNKWARSQPGSSYVQIENNKATGYSITAGANSYLHFNTYNQWYITGSAYNIDFNLGYDSGNTDSTYWFIYIYVRSVSDPSNHRQEARFIYNPSVYGAETPLRSQCVTRCNGGNVGGSAETSNVTTFNARLIRSGTTFTSYYDIGDGWVESLSTVCATFPTDGVEIAVIFYNYDINDTTAVLWCDEIIRNSSSATYFYYLPKRIAVTDSDGFTQLPVEVERWDHWNKSYVLWTKTQTITASGTASNKLYLYYDADKTENTDYIGDVGSAVGRSVWDENFKGVWHLSEDPTGGANCIIDSTARLNHGTPANMAADDDITAKIYKGLDFDGVDDEVDFGAEADFDVTDNFTVECLMKSSLVQGDYSRMVGKEIAGANRQFDLGFGPGGYLRFYGDYDGGGQWSSNYNGNYADNLWHYLGGSFNTEDKVRLMVDDDETSATLTDITLSKSEVELQIGRTASVTNPYTGVLDEVRFSNIARSTAWRKATYYTCFDNLIIYSNEENYPPMHIVGTVHDKYGFPMTEICNVIVSDLDGDFVASDVTENDGTFDIGVPAPADEKFIVTFYRQGHYRLDEDIAGAVFLTPTIS